MRTADRRSDIDWIRVIAIGLLLVYHIAIGFQSWGVMIGFISNEKTWDTLWIPMSMLNVWRIPLLFFVSGIGVFFAIRNRSWKQLLLERAGRIFIPFVFGALIIVPVHLFLWQYYYKANFAYTPNPGHLWFLGNIFTYVIVLSPLFFYLKNNAEGYVAKWITKILGNPLGILPVIAVFAIEAILVDPRPYEMYAMTWHGFILGLLAFLFGFCYVLSGNAFREMTLKWRWVFLAVAVALFTIRLTLLSPIAPGYLLAIESNLWILSVFGFGNKYLNHSGKVLTYLSSAAYPVYILHMIFLYLGSLIIFPLDLPFQLQFILVLIITVAGCFIFYELIIRRINFIRPLFGLKMKERRAIHVPYQIHNPSILEKNRIL